MIQPRRAIKKAIDEIVSIPYAKNIPKIIKKSAILSN